MTISIRRGFNRLYLILYAAWLIWVVVEGHLTAYQQREHFAQKLSGHVELTQCGTVTSFEDLDRRMKSLDTKAEWISLDLRLFERRFLESTPEWTYEQREQALISVEKVLHGKAEPEECKYFTEVIRPRFPDIFGKYLTSEEIAEYTSWRDYPFLTWTKERFTRPDGWLLVFVLPGGLYGSILGFAYAARWVYRGFASTDTIRTPSTEADSPPAPFVAPPVRTQTSSPELGREAPLIDHSSATPHGLTPDRESEPRDGGLSKYRGVGGWLLFFCVTVLFFQPLGFLVGFLSNLWVFEMVREELPEFRVFLTVFAIGGTIQVALGIWTGVALIKLRPAAPALAKRFLWYTLGFSILVSLFLSDLSGSEALKFFIASALYFVLWYAYFSRSKRVAATYGT